MLTNTRRSRSLWLISSVLFTLVIFIGFFVHHHTTTTTATGPLQAAVERMHTAETYRLIARAEQTLRPRATPEMIGTQGQHHTFYLEGAVRHPNQSNLTIRKSGQPPLTLITDGQQTFAQRNGQIEPVDSAADLDLPTLDFLSYLSNATDVRSLDERERLGVLLTGYQFTIDTEQMAAQYADQLQSLLNEPLPPGASFSAAHQLAAMTGTGEVWLDPAGYPVEQTIVLVLPQNNNSYDTTVELAITFRDIGTLETILQPVATAEGGWALQNHTITPSTGTDVTASSSLFSTIVTLLPTSQQFIAVLTILGLLGLTLFVIVAYRRSPHHTYLVIALSLTIMIVSGPLLQQARIVSVTESAHAAATEQQADQQFATDLQRQVADNPQARALLGQGLGQPTSGQPERYQTTTFETELPETCGEGSKTDDSDSDGLSDYVEGCLGTDPSDSDTDSDAISDGTEVLTGFVGLDNQTWYSDPLLSDSNYDGNLDSAEWPETVNGVETGGSATSVDYDSDNLPNVWDDDDDNDGVSDTDDLSPFTAGASGQSSFTIETAYNATDATDRGFLYMDFQLRPDDLESLYYGANALDWPLDTKGQITDTNDDGSTITFEDDLYLVPVLRLDVTSSGNFNADNTLSSVSLEDSDLDADYGITLLTNDDSQTLYVPLYAIDDNGQPTAYQGRIVFNSDAPDKMVFDAAFIWLVETEDNDFVQYYNETFTLTGVRVARHGGSEVLVAGDPATSGQLDQHAALLQLYLGLAHTFLYGESLVDQTADTFLQEIENRLNGANIQSELRYGIDFSLLAERQTFDHQDQALAGRSTMIEDYLNTNNYINADPADQCLDEDDNPYPCAGLMVALEEIQGLVTTDELLFYNGSVDFTNMAFDLDSYSDGGDVVMTSYRYIQLNTYEYDSTTATWDTQSFERLFQAIEKVYSLEELASELQDEYEGVTADDIEEVLMIVYSAGYIGGTTIANLEGDDLLAFEADTYLGKTVTSSLTRGVRSIEHFWKLFFINGNSYFTYTNIVFEDTDGRKRLYARIEVTEAAKTDNASEWVKFKEAYTEKSYAKMAQKAGVGIGRAAIVVGTLLYIGFSITAAVCEANGDTKCQEKYENMAQATNIAIQAGSLLERGLGWVGKVYKGGKFTSVIATANVSKWGRFKNAISKLTTTTKVVVAVYFAGLILEITGYVVYAIMVASSDVPSFIKTEAIVYAVVASIIAIILFILSLIPPIDVILAILALIDAIVAFATGGDVQIMQTVSRAIASFFYGADVLTVPDEFEVTSGSDNGLQQGTSATDAGLIVGNKYIYSMILASSFEDYGKDSTSYGSLWYDDKIEGALKDSEGKLTFTVDNVSGTADVDVTNNTDCTTDTNDLRTTCLSTATTTIDFTAAQQNLSVPIDYEIDYNYFYIETIAGVPNRKQEKESEGPTTIGPLIFDVLPNTVGGIWDWSGIDNPDSDGDGVTDAIENSATYSYVNSSGVTITGQQTDPNNPDSDGDGLTDGYEINNSSDATLAGLNPVTPDTDNDTLTDAQELFYGTPVDESDTDGDGLTDAQEVYHEVYTISTINDTYVVSSTGTWSGGWDVTVEGVTLRVSSDPYDDDWDGDDYDDSDERTNATSPWISNGDLTLINVLLGGSSTTVNAATTTDATTPVTDQTSTTTETTVGELLTRGINTSSSLTTTPGNTISVGFELRNGGDQTITQPVTLALDPLFSLLTGPTLNRADGPVPDPTLTTGSDGTTTLSWDLGASDDAYTLLQNEVVSTTFTVSLTSPDTASGDITFAVSTGEETLDRVLSVTVDADDPTVQITAPADGAVLAGTSTVVGIAAADLTSAISSVTLTDGTNDLTVTGAGTTWASTWDLPADGTYTLTAAATDEAGNTATSDPVTVSVDNTAPTITTTLADQTIVSTLNDGTTVDLAGTVTDNLTGLNRLQIRIDGAPWQDIPVTSSFPTSYDWSYTWSLSADAQGEHTIELRAWDRAGNLSDLLTRTLLVDLLAPITSLTDPAYTDSTIPVVSSDSPLVLDGSIIDQSSSAVRPDPVALTGDLDSLDDATVWLEFDHVSDATDVTLTWLGDVDGDGRGDLAIGTPNAGANNTGEITIIYGQTGDWDTPPDGELLGANGNTRLLGIDSAQLGQHIAPAGDINGDGLYDLLVGDPVNNRVFLVFGRTGGIAVEATLAEAQTGRWVMFDTPETGYTLGETLAAAGDVNADGYGDLLLGATSGTSQRLYLIAGQPAGEWTSTVPVANLAAATLTTDIDAIVSGVGDVDGDQLADFVVGDTASATLYPGSLAYDTATQMGLDSSSSTAQFTATAARQLAALGDVNGDQLADFAYGDDSGQVWLVLGRTSGDWSSTLALHSASNLPNLGTFLAAPGDVNADGTSDLLLGATDANTNTPIAYLVHGGSELATRVTNGVVAPEATLFDVAGAASTPYSAGADLNCDDSSELLLLPQKLVNSPYADPDLGAGTLPDFPVDTVPFTDPDEVGETVTTLNGIETSATYTLVVDDDYCDTCANDGYSWGNTAFATLQAAVDAVPGDDTQIIIRPGVYTGAVINTATNLSIRGIDPDAVFITTPNTIDTTYALSATNVSGLTISGLTLRDVPIGIGLNNAGVGGYEVGQEALRTTLDNLLIDNFSQYGLAMDRLSTADIQSTTFAGATGSTAVYVDPNNVDPALASFWYPQEALPQNATTSTELAIANDTLYTLLEKNGNHTLYSYDLTQGSSPTTANWSERAGLALGESTVMSDLVADANGKLYTVRDTTGWTTIDNHVYVVEIDSNNDVYVGGSFNVVYDPNGDPIEANNIARWDSSESRWYPVGRGVNNTVYAIELDETNNKIYVGGSFTSAYQSNDSTLSADLLVRFDTTTETWESINSTLTNGAVRALLVDGTNLFIGGTFDNLIALWNSSSQTWVSVPRPSDSNTFSRYYTGIYDFEVKTSGSNIYAAATTGIINFVYDSATGTWSWNDSQNGGFDVGKGSQLSGVLVNYNGTVYAIAEQLYTNRVFGGGDFTQISYWDSFTIVTPTGSGGSTTEIVYTGDAIQVNNIARGVPGVGGINHIGYHLGNTNSVSEMNGIVYDLFLKGTTLYVVGAFNNAVNRNGNTANVEGLTSTNGVGEGGGSGNWADFELDFTPNPNNGGEVRTVALDASNNIYLGGSFDTVQHSTNATLQANQIVAQIGGTWQTLNTGVDRLPSYMYQYDPTTNTWTTFITFGDVGNLVSGGRYLYATEKDGTAFYRYDTDNNLWARQADLPAAVDAGTTMVYVDYGTATTDDDELYLLRGRDPLSSDPIADGSNDFYRYDVSTNTWSTTEAFPSPDSGGSTAIIDTGASLTWDQDDSLYATAAGGGKSFARFSLTSQSWQLLPTADLTTAAGFSSGASLRYYDDGTEPALFATEIDNTPNLYRYAPVGVTSDPKLTFTDVAFVAEDTTTAAWLNADLGSPTDFSLDYTGTNSWVTSASGGWSVTLPTGASELTLAQAAFVDTANGNYRVQAPSQLASGYRDNTTPQSATVAPTYCEGCANDGLTWGIDAFSSIQAALASGASTIDLEPGRYQEAVYLLNGVTLQGTSAESTILAPPPGFTGDAFVTAEGLTADLSRVTLTGETTTGGLSLTDGADLTVSRSIVRDATIALAVDGTSTQLTLTNATIVNNTDGVLATNGASLDLTASVLAFHTGTALNSASTPARTAVAYWQNTADLIVNGQPLPVSDGDLEALQSDPLFTNPSVANYRPADGSPLIDARADGSDIGYLEVAQATLTVDDDFCDTCANDGLTWGVDAFSSIQAAIDAAAPTIDALLCAEARTTSDDDSCDQVTILVQPGTYNEALTLLSRIQLLGSGAGDPTNPAQQTIISGGGTSSPVVTLDNVHNVAIRGFQITNSSSSTAIAVSGSSQDVLLSHLLITEVATGVAFSEAASGQLRFSTLIGATTAGVSASDTDTSLVVRNSLILDSPTGLQQQGDATLVAAYSLLDGTTTSATAGVTLEATVVDDLTSTERATLFRDEASGDYRLTPDSLAVNAATPFTAPEPVPADVNGSDDYSQPQAGGGDRADLGYQELLGVPLTLLFGSTANSACSDATSGPQQVEVALVPVADATAATTATLPTAGDWVSLPIATTQSSAFWSQDLTPISAGLHRIYLRGTDQAGNQAVDDTLYAGQVVVDTTAPTIAWSTPTTTSDAAALTLRATVADYIDSGGTLTFNVDSVAFTVNGTRYPADWDDSGGWDATSQQPRTFTAIVPLPEGAVTLAAVATDQAGRTSSVDATLTVTTPADGVASITSPSDSAALATDPVVVQGYARFPSSATAPQVQVRSTSSGSWVDATLASPGATLTTWTAELTLADGAHPLEVRLAHSGGSLSAASSGPTITVDTQAPNTLNLDPQSAPVDGILTLSGSARDAASGSGLASVAVSLDNACTWLDATLDPSTGDWSVAWSPDLFADDLASLPLTLRAVDTAGNVYETTDTLQVDAVAPDGLEPVTANVPASSYITSADALTLTWNEPTDNLDATPDVFVEFSTDANLTALPSETVTGQTSFSTTPDTTGAWYGYLTTQDDAGNRSDLQLGPWYVSTDAPYCYDASYSSGPLGTRYFILDGTIDAAAGEWRQSSERLDVDERPATPQALYYTWDSQVSYLGWDGALWDQDGSLLIYATVGSQSGTTTPLLGPTDALPLAATHAVVVDGSGARLWTSSGGSWQTSSDPLLAAVSAGDQTEVRLPWSVQASGLELFVVALDAEQTPWAVFPTTTSLDPVTWASSSPYRWSNQCTVSSPNADQPLAPSLVLEVTHEEQHITDGSTLSYQVTLTNQETEPLSGLELLVTPETPLSGAQVSGTGVSCSSCADGASSWTLTLPNLAAGETLALTLVGTLPSGLSASTTLTTDWTLSQSGASSAVVFPTASTDHQVDTTGPTVTLEANQLLTPDVVAIILGATTDGAGVGTALVEVSSDGGATWITATGTTAWRSDQLAPSSGELALLVRATDQLGNQSTQALSLAVDTTAPEVSATIPSVVRTTDLLVQGTAQDQPSGDGVLSRVELLLPDVTDDSWQVATTSPNSAVAGAVPWSYAWELDDLDGISQTLQVRAIDTAANVSTVLNADVLVDNMAPALTVTTTLEQVTLGDYLMGQTDGTPVLSGTVSDGSGIAAVRIEGTTPANEPFTQTATLEGNSWTFVPELANLLGTYRWQVVAEDSVGNRSRSGTYAVDVVDSDLGGLVVWNDSPTVLGATTSFTATIATGTNTIFEWTFGDGATATGSSVQHTYAAVGTYVATVTATNGSGTQVATTQVTVEAAAPAADPRVYLPLVRMQPVGLASDQPDLGASGIQLTPNQTTFTAGEPVEIAVMLTNTGATATTSGFWVDLFIDPDVVPTADLLPLKWDDTCGERVPCFGIAWRVDTPLAPGDSITLVSVPADAAPVGTVGYAPAYTVWPGWFAAGTQDLYVYVDAWTDGEGAGAIGEPDDSNNRLELRGLSVTGTNPAPPSTAPQARP